MDTIGCYFADGVKTPTAAGGEGGGANVAAAPCGREGGAGREGGENGRLRVHW